MATIIFGVEKLKKKKGSAADGFGFGSGFGFSSSLGGLLGSLLLDSSPMNEMMKKKKKKKGSAADGFGSSSFGGGLLGLLDSMLMKDKMEKKKKAAYKASDQEDSDSDSDSDDNEDDHRKREADALFKAIMKDLFGPTLMNQEEREKMMDPMRNVTFRGSRGGLVSFKEDDEVKTVRMEMPGLGKEDVKVSVVNDTLVIKETDDENEKNNFTMNLPERVYKCEELKAVMKNGVLTVVVPKKKDEERKDAIIIQVQD